MGGMVSFVVMVALLGFEVYVLMYAIEHIRCIYIKKQIPFVPSADVLRVAVANEICKNYPNAKTICDIGSGYGGLARYVARSGDFTVTALENMPFTFFIARVLSVFSCAKVQNVRCDAFEYLKKYDGVFDVGVAYLGPHVNHRLVDILDKFRVLIVLDAPIPQIKPVRVVDVGHGYTRYGRKAYPHKLFIYTK